MIFELLSHPSFILLNLAILLYLMQNYKVIFTLLALSIPLIAAATFYGANDLGAINLFGFQLIPMVYSNYNKFFGYGFLISYFATTIYALQREQYGEIVTGTVYAAFGLLGLLSGDFISLFISLEGMMIAASVLIFIGPYVESKQSAMRYFLIHIIAGTLFISGVAILMHDNGYSFSRAIKPINLDFFELTKQNIAGILIFISCLINVGAPPFSYWITDSYPQAKSSGTVFLSSFTTKLAVYCLLILFPGQKVLIYIGIIMVLYGISYAVLEYNLRRILCFLIINQLGLMLIGIGIGSESALLATCYIALFHILYKTLLMIIAGNLVDRYQAYNAGNLSIIALDKFTLNFAILATLFMIAVPFTGPYFAKNLLGAELINYSPRLYALLIGSNAILLLSYPWKQIKSGFEYNNQVPLALGTKISLIFVSIALIACSLLLPQITLNLLGINKEVIYNILDIYKSLFIIAAGILLTLSLYNYNYKKPGELLTFDYFKRLIKIPKIGNWYDNQDENIRIICSNMLAKLGQQILVVNKQITRLPIGIGLLVTICGLLLIRIVWE